MKERILVASLLLFGIAVSSFPQTPPENVVPGRRLQATVTGRSTMFSFTTATSGELVIEATNFADSPAGLMVLGPDYQQVGTNATSDSLNPELRFQARENSVYHLSATLLDESTPGGNLDLVIRAAQSVGSNNATVPVFTYLYGDIGK